MIIEKYNSKEEALAALAMVAENPLAAPAMSGIGYKVASEAVALASKGEQVFKMFGYKWGAEGSAYVPDDSQIYLKLMSLVSSAFKNLCGPKQSEYSDNSSGRLRVEVELYKENLYQGIDGKYSVCIEMMITVT